MDTVKARFGKSIGLLVFLSLFVACGIEMETLSLDEVNMEATVSNSNSFEYFRAPKVFENDPSDVWGMEKDSSKDFKIVNLDDEHKNVIQLKWNRTSEWVGFGIGWNKWQAKDLSDITEEGGFVFDVRAIDDRSNIPTLIFLLEDYSGVMSAGVVGSESLQRYPINEEWQSFRLPLSAFDIASSGIDLTNIKQLVVEFQGSGQLYVDNIQLIECSPYNHQWKEEFPSSKVRLDESTVVFDGNFDQVWGLGQFGTRNYQITPRKTLEMKWNNTEFSAKSSFGTSWANWKFVDLSAVQENASLTFEVQNLQGVNQELGLEVLLQDYSYNQSPVTINGSTSSMSDFTKEWVKIDIPLSTFAKNNLQMENIKQLIFRTQGSGHIEIRDIKIRVNE